MAHSYQKFSHKSKKHAKNFHLALHKLLQTDNIRGQVTISIFKHINQKCQTENELKIVILSNS